MRRLAAAALIAFLPLSAHAQTQEAAPANPEPKGTCDWATGVALTAGVLGAVVIADVLTEGALSGPLLRATGLDGALAAATATPPTAIAPLPRPWWRFW